MSKFTTDIVFFFFSVRLHIEVLKKVVLNHLIGLLVLQTIQGQKWYSTGVTMSSFFALSRLVTKAWGYYLLGGSMRITSNGKEYSPRISFPTNSGSWYNLRSEVRGTQVKIYVNDKLVKKITMLGDGADAKSNNQVGIWCHSSIPAKGDSFKGNVKRNFLNEKYPDKLLLFNVLVISFLRIRFWLVPKLPSGYESGYNFKRKTPSCRTQWIKRHEAHGVFCAFFPSIQWAVQGIPNERLYVCKSN